MIISIKKNRVIYNNNSNINSIIMISIKNNRIINNSDIKIIIMISIKINNYIDNNKK